MENNNESGEIADVSLSAAILAPLSALVKAQVHNSRAFLSYLLQLGYRHVNFDDKGMPLENQDMTPYTLPFVNKVHIDGREALQQIEIPALALVSSVPLGVESAEFEYNFMVEDYKPHEQLQLKRDDNPTVRPWYLVEQPVSFRGNVCNKPPGDDSTGHTKSSAAIHIKIKVGKMAIPSGLDKLLTTLTQSATVQITDNSANQTA